MRAGPTRRDRWAGSRMRGPPGGGGEAVPGCRRRRTRSGYLPRPGSGAPGSEGRSSASSVPGVRSESCDAPWRSCMTWVRNSMSLRLPFPNLRWKSGSSSAGMRSFSTRALISRIDLTDTSGMGRLHITSSRRSVKDADRARVAGNRAGPNQCQQLPGLYPVLVVAAVALQGPGQGPAPALRPDLGVQGVGLAVAPRLAENPSHVGGDAQRSAPGRCRTRRRT